MSPNQNEFVRELEVEVEVELRIAGESQSEVSFGTSTADWLFDPIEVEREEVGLRNLLGAVEALDSYFQPDEENLPGALQGTPERRPGQNRV